ncbi:MAG: hypothetical protein HY748_15190 [Elusimicrobia bacterium]|nr:hypothetical protein [Elusimicrobiota bacterium]
MTAVIDRNGDLTYTNCMASRSLRLILAVALFWTGTHLCLMPQADCEGRSKARSRAPCHGQTGDQGHCCDGVHLTEAGVPSGQALASAARTPHPAGLLSAGPELAVQPTAVQTPQASIAGSHPRPPPRESFGRSPPSCA